MVKRSLLYLRRKYKRSVLLLLLLFVISFSLAVGVTVWNSIGSVTKEVQDALGTSFTFRIPSYITNDASYYKEVNDSSGNAQKCYVGPKLDNETIQQIMQNIDGITGYNAEMDNYVCVEDADLIPGMHSDNWKYDFGDPDTNARMSQRQYVTMIYGNSKTELYNEFRSGSFELIAGRHITPNDTYKTLISDELAEANGLEIGDILTLTARAGIAGLVPSTEIWGEPLSVEIVGIFHVNGYQPTGQWVAETDMSYNWLITDIETVNYFNEVYNKELYVGQAYEQRYRNVTFFVEDASQLDATIKAVQDLDVIDTSYPDCPAVPLLRPIGREAGRSDLMVAVDAEHRRLYGGKNFLHLCVSPVSVVVRSYISKQNQSILLCQLLAVAKLYDFIGVSVDITCVIDHWSFHLSFFIIPTRKTHIRDFPKIYPALLA